jgi:hypothetical protein
MQDDLGIVLKAPGKTEMKSEPSVPSRTAGLHVLKSYIIYRVHVAKNQSFVQEA